MNLTGQQIKDTYEGLLNIGATGLTGALQTITDGLGNPLPMQVSNTTVNFTGIVTGIVGTTGPAGPTGAQGPIGPTGAGGASATGALQTDAAISGTLQVVKDSLGNSSALRISCVDVTNYGGGAQTSNTAFGDNALVCNTSGTTNTAFGYLAGQQVTTGSKNLFLGALTNSNAIPGDSNVAIGYATLWSQTGCNNIAIGEQVMAYNNSNINNNNVSIGHLASSYLYNGSNNTVVGTCSFAQNNTSRPTPLTYNTIIGAENLKYTPYSENSTIIGNRIDTVAGYCTSGIIGIGTLNCFYPGATGTIVLGNSSVGGTGACDSVVIGNSSQTTAACGISIGNNIVNEQANSIVIGSGNSSIICGGTPGQFNTIIGTSSSCINAAYDSNSIIGSQISIIGTNSYRTHLLGGYSNNACADHSSIISGSENCIKNGYYSNILGGQDNKIGYSDYGRFSTIISSIGSCYTGGYGPNTILGGCLNTISSSDRFNNIIGGCSNTIGSAYCNVTIIGGKSITASKSDTVYVPSLIAEGQAASRAYSLGVTGTNVSVDWDNSNVQTMELLGSGTLTMSNPIDGGVYTLQITQGAGGGHTITWSNVKWPGGAPPSLSITAGAVDILTFIYGPTAYYGNANLNFS